MIILGLAAFLVLAVVMSIGLYSVCAYADRVRRENIRKWTPAEESEMARIARVSNRAAADMTVMWWAPGHSEAAEILKDIERLQTKITLSDPTAAPLLFEEVERRTKLITRRAASKPKAGHPRVMALQSVYADLVARRL